MKLLQESYLGKVKMIYIDPPYNTGNDFVYCDEFAAGCEEYLDKKGQCDSDGNRLFKNTETNGRFHSDWCSMMYPRLKIARDLLSDDGVIFVSISVKEFATLRKIMDEVFGEQNFLYHLSVVNKLNGNDNSSGMMETEEFCLIYAKSKDVFEMGVLPIDDQEEADEWEQDEKGYWKLGGSLKATGINAPRAARPNLFFPIYINPHTLEWSLEPLAGIGLRADLRKIEAKLLSKKWEIHILCIKNKDLNLGICLASAEKLLSIILAILQLIVMLR